MAKVTDDEYEMLTEEERVGLKEYQAELDAEREAEDALIAAAAAGDPEDPSPETPDKPIKPEKPEKPTKAEDEEVDDEEVDDDDEDPIDTEEEAEESAEEEVEGQTGAADDDEEDPPAQPRKKAIAQVSIPTTMPRLTDAEEKRLVTIKGQLKELAQKFDDGELTAVEWRDEQEKLEDERDVLKEKRAVAAMTTQTSVNTWYQSTIPLFLAEHPEYKEGTLRHKLLDTIVRELQMGSVTPTDPKILAKAHERITTELGAVSGEEKPAVPKKKPNGAKRPSPPKFADIPSSDQNEVTQPNKFARLDKLNGIDYERALSKLTPTDREFYLQGGG